mmetsp:Transcript_25793/g.70958  ORF Transcript_25793/g.70958 Transcript_25793/m.70958 type:complete len:94 (-) Transcript_25793:17-298(-)
MCNRRLRRKGDGAPSIVGIYFEPCSALKDPVFTKLTLKCKQLLNNPSATTTLVRPAHPCQEGKLRSAAATVAACSTQHTAAQMCQVCLIFAEF